MHFPPAVIQHLATFGAPAEQVVPINEFFQCYDILLSHPACPLHQTWTETKVYLSAKNENLPLGVNTSITRNCLSAAVAVPQPNWPVIYLLAMLWGFGETAKDGPAKLFVSTQTQLAEAKLTRVANQVLAGNLAAAFDDFCLTEGSSKLKQVATSFGTKFIFAVGMGLHRNAIRPLVYDGRIGAAIKSLKTHFPAEMTRAIFPWLEDVKCGTNYLAYCACINETAVLMNPVGAEPNDHWDAYKLEQLLFQHGKNIV